MFTVRKYADKIGVPRPVVNEWLRQGMPYSINSAGHRVIDPAVAERWLAERRKPKEETKMTMRIPVAVFVLTAKVKVVLGIAGQFTGRVFNSVKGWLFRREISRVKRNLASVHLSRGFSLAIIPHDAAGKVVQFAFNRRVLRILLVVAILAGFAFAFLLGIAAAIPSLNRTIHYQDMVIEAYAAENEELRTALEDALGIKERFDVIEDILTEPVAEPQARIAGLQEENPNVPIPQEVKDLVRRSGMLQFMTAELAEEMAGLDACVQEYAEKTEATPNMWPTEGRVTSGYGTRAAVFGSYFSRGRDGEEVLITHTFHAGNTIALPFPYRRVHDSGYGIACL